MKIRTLILISILYICMECSSGKDIYNRGIGIYPGNPLEDFSTSLHVDNTYRNKARFDKIVLK